ncbi:MAG TPA: hypothetical protein VFN18_09910 [Solirubrobacterales bacterium]|nr:hypothetical protein [Solirubrobacterales bacterium]
MNENLASKKRPRSPSYPIIDLGKAVERAEAIYRHEGKYLAHIDSILGHWGYTARSGRALRQLAALKKFGLTSEEGSKNSRQIQLTELGLYIVMPDSPERADALKKAALTPTIHRELQAKYPDGLPSDSTVRWYLKAERNFTEQAAVELVAEYKATMRFAGLDKAPVGSATVEVTDDPNDDFDQGQDGDMTPPAVEQPQAPAAPTAPPTAQAPSQQPASAGPLRDVTIPLAGTAWVKVAGEFPMAEASWDQMMKMLEAMKPGLTRAEEE